jgi:hypothetical protein
MAPGKGSLAATPFARPTARLMLPESEALLALSAVLLLSVPLSPLLG